MKTPSVVRYPASSISRSINRSLGAGVAVILLIVSSGASAPAAAQLTDLLPIEYVIPPTRYSSLELADLEGDGDLDLAITGLNVNGSPIVGVFLMVDQPYLVSAGQNDPYIVKEFESLNVAAPGVAYGELTFADYDQDGDLDFVITGLVDYVDGFERINEPIVHVYENLWPPERDLEGWTSPFVKRFELSGLYQSAAGWGDLDGDGDPDIVVSGLPAIGAREGVTRVYRNDGDAFVEVPVELPGVKWGDVAWGDFDGDGDADLAIMGDASDGAYITRVYRNEGDGTFVDIGLPAPGLAHGSIQWADYDNDGDLDLLVSGMRLDPRLMLGVTLVYRNDGGILVESGHAFEGIGNGAAAWADLEGDGDLDVFLLGTSEALGEPVLRIYEFVDGEYTHVLDAPGYRFSALAVGDYNGDGDADIVLTGESGQFTQFQFLMNWLNQDCAIKWYPFGLTPACSP